MSATAFHINTEASSALIDLRVTADYGKKACDDKTWSVMWTSAKTVKRASLVNRCYLEWSLGMHPFILLLSALGVVCGFWGEVFLALENRFNNGIKY
jgi:hypothetical protein